MSNFSKPRVKKTLPEGRLFKRHRDAIDSLLKDFDGRCAYSQQHEDLAGGRMCIDVDHFNPKIRNSSKNRYGNLLPATRHCNGKKSDIWPSNADAKLGIRLINPSVERDYDVHIFEEPETNRLVGLTPAGKYQIRVCDLNAPHLITERRLRSYFRERMQAAIIARDPLFMNSELRALLDDFVAHVEKMIPLISAPPKQD